MVTVMTTIALCIRSLPKNAADDTTVALTGHAAF
jgi:hypothetical protein